MRLRLLRLPSKRAGFGRVHIQGEGEGEGYGEDYGEGEGEGYGER